MENDDRAERQYRNRSAFLTYWGGEFEYLHGTGTSREAASLGLFALMSGLSLEALNDIEARHFAGRADRFSILRVQRRRQHDALFSGDAR